MGWSRKGKDEKGENKETQREELRGDGDFIPLSLNASHSKFPGLHLNQLFFPWHLCDVTGSQTPVNENSERE